RAPRGPSTLRFCFRWRSEADVDACRASRRTSIADLVAVTTTALLPVIVGVTTVIRRRADHAAVAVHIDIRRGCAAPGEIGNLHAFHLVAVTAQRDVARFRIAAGCDTDILAVGITGAVIVGHRHADGVSAIRSKAVIDARTRRRIAVTEV